MTETLSLLRAITLGFTCLLVGIGIGRFGYPALIPAVIKAGWASAETAHVAAASNLAGYLVGALAAPLIVRWIGARATVLSCLWLTVVSFAIPATPLPPVPFVALRFLSGFTGGALMTAVAPMITLMVGAGQRGRANGYAFSGVGIGFILSGTLVPALADRDLAVAWLAISAVLALMAGIAWQALPRGDAPVPVASAKEGTSNGAAVGLAIAYCCAAAGYIPASVIFVDYVGRVLGLGLGVGGAIWVATGVSAVVSPLIAGPMADRYGVAPVLRTVLLLMGLGAAIPAFTSVPWLLALSGMLAGGLMIALASLVSGRAREITSADRHAGLWARLTVLFAVVQAAFAYAVSGFLVVSDNYALLFLAAAATTLSGLAVEILASRARRSP